MNEHSPPLPTPHHSRPARPARPRRVRGAALRGRLLAAAEALVAERQVAAITARDIAQAAGVADGALYNHFGDKHELILEALLARFGRVVATYEEEVADVRGADPPLPIETALVGLTAAASRLQAATLPMFAHVLSEPALFHRFMVAIHQPPYGDQVFMDPFEGYLDDERRAGRIADVAPGVAADMLVGAVLLHALLDLLGPRPAGSRETQFTDMVRTLVSGLAPRPQPR